MKDRTSKHLIGGRSRLTPVSGVGAVSLLVMATLLIGVVASPVLAAKGEERGGGGTPQRQVEHVRQIAQSLVRSAVRTVRTQRDVPVAVGLACTDRMADAFTLRGTFPTNDVRGCFRSHVRVGLLNLPPPIVAFVAG